MAKAWIETTPNPRVHRLPKGEHIAPMPPLRKTRSETRLPGGLPPVAYRSANARWCTGNRGANEPFASRATRMEILTTNPDWKMK